MTLPLSGKSVLVWFGVVLLCYLGIFYGIEYWRSKDGPWLVVFQVDGQGQPSVVVHQPKLNIANLQIRFPEQTLPAPDRTNLPQTVVFDRPLKPLPFGKRLHEDLTTRPGVITFDLFGHLVELAPRALTLDARRLAWPTPTRFELWSTNKPPQPLKPSGGKLDDEPAQAGAQS